MAHKDSDELKSATAAYEDALRKDPSGEGFHVKLARKRYDRELDLDIEHSRNTNPFSNLRKLDRDGNPIDPRAKEEFNPYSSPFAKRELAKPQGQGKPEPKGGLGRGSFGKTGIAKGAGSGFNPSKDSPIAGAEKGFDNQAKKQPDQKDKNQRQSGAAQEYGKSFEDEYGEDQQGGLRQRTISSIKNYVDKSIATVQNSHGDPRALVGQVSEDLFKTGEKLGHALFVVWGAVFILTSVPFVFTGLPALFIWNMLMVSPKLVYRLTEFILDFVGVGEALQTADEFGITNVDIKLKTGHKLVIVFCDAVYFYIIFLIIVALVASVCYSINGPSNTERAIIALVSPVSGQANDLARLVVPKEIKDFCSSFMGSLNSTIGGNIGGSGGGGNGSGGGSGGPRCQPAQPPSPASIENLSSSCFAQYGSEVVRQASIVAQAESNGNPSLPVGAGSCGAGRPPARCIGGEIPVWGLYQINITVHQVAGLNCPAAFSGPWTCSRQCQVINQSLYQACARAAVNPTNNINAACSIYQRNIDRGRSGWYDWGNVPNEHANRCGF